MYSAGLGIPRWDFVSFAFGAAAYALALVLAALVKVVLADFKLRKVVDAVDPWAAAFAGFAGQFVSIVSGYYGGIINAAAAGAFASIAILAHIRNSYYDPFFSRSELYATPGGTVVGLAAGVMYVLQ